MELTPKGSGKGNPGETKTSWEEGGEADSREYVILLNSDI